MMSSNTLRRAGRALLFGGAIAATTSAQAGLTLQTTVILDGANFGNQNYLNAYVVNTNITDIQPGEGYYGYLNAQAHSNWTGGAFAFTPHGSSVSWSPFTSTGFSMAASSGVNGNSYAYSMNIWFAVDTAGYYRLTTGAGGQLHFWHYGGTLEAPTVAGTTGVDLNTAFSSFDGTFFLERGLHRLNTWASAAQGDPSASTFVNLQQVPAPGAAALLGVAGLVRGRRRR